MRDLLSVVVGEIFRLLMTVSMTEGPRSGRDAPCPAVLASARTPPTELIARTLAERMRDTITDVRGKVYKAKQGVDPDRAEQL